MSDEEYLHALNEWRAARDRFEYAATPDKTELAVYELLSARQKVVYLLRR